MRSVRHLGVVVGAGLDPELAGLLGGEGVVHRGRRHAGGGVAERVADAALMGEPQLVGVEGDDPRGAVATGVARQVRHLRRLVVPGFGVDADNDSSVCRAHRSEDLESPVV